jgi:hypothetical protein
MKKADISKIIPQTTFLYETNTINKTHKVMIMLSCEFHLTLKNKI